MTVEAIERVEDRRRAVSLRIVALAAAILAAGLGAVGAAIILGGGGTTVSAYDAELAPLVARHNEVVGRWNAFLTEYNGISLADPAEFDARAAGGRDLTQALVTDSQGVILAWDQVTPPPDMAAAHRFARDAMVETQNGFIELSKYFSDIVQYGIAFNAGLEAGTSRLDNAAILWSQARAASTGVN